MAWADTPTPKFVDLVGMDTPFILRAVNVGDPIDTSYGKARVVTMTVARDNSAPSDLCTIIGKQIERVADALEPADLPAECIMTHGPNPDDPNKTIKRLMRLSTYRDEQRAATTDTPNPEATEADDGGYRR